jgi:hypothetical protein
MKYVRTPGFLIDLRRHTLKTAAGRSLNQTHQDRGTSRLAVVDPGSV